MAKRSPGGAAGGETPGVRPATRQSGSVAALRRRAWVARSVSRTRAGCRSTRRPRPRCRRRGGTRSSRRCRISYRSGLWFSRTLRRYVLGIRDQACGIRPVRLGVLREDREEHVAQDGLLAVVGARPRGGVADRPAHVLGQASRNVCALPSEKSAKTRSRSRLLAAALIRLPSPQ
jgi:hypothetical protein